MTLPLRDLARAAIYRATHFRSIEEGVGVVALAVALILMLTHVLLAEPAQEAAGLFRPSIGKGASP
jgi:hypothetical protein